MIWASMTRNDDGERWKIKQQRETGLVEVPGCIARGYSPRSLIETLHMSEAEEFLVPSKLTQFLWLSSLLT